jgi:hypothetical protein
MLKFVETYKKKSELRRLKLKYRSECDYLSCCQFALKKSIARNEEVLCNALRETIAASMAECNAIRAKINLIYEWLNIAKSNNKTITT